MAVQTRSIPKPKINWSLPKINTFTDVLGVMFWVLGVGLTHITVAFFIPIALFSWPVALLIQRTLTYFQVPVWNRWAINADGKAVKRKIGVSAIIALVVDAVLNLPGIWQALRQAHLSPPAAVIGEMLGRELPRMSGWTALGFAMLGAAILCGLPEVLWGMKGRP